MRKVVVTGVGAVTPIGIGREGLWQGLHEQRSGVHRVSRFDPSPYNCNVAAEVRGFQPAQWIAPKAMKRMDRYSRFCVSAAKMAMEDARLDLNVEDRDRVGCMIGSALGGVGFAEMEYEHYYEGGFRAVNLSLALSVFGGAGPCNIAIQFGINGPTSANADSCAAGPIALGRAMDAIRKGECDVMVAGGADAPITPLAFGAFDLIRAMSTRFNDCPERASRPFDVGRDGFVLGEGAAMMVLESEEHARARGATCLAEIKGVGLTNDGHHMTSPRPDAGKASRAIELALLDAGVKPQDVDVVSAHGSSTPLNDPTETRALKQVFGDHAYKMPIIGTKSRHGHSLGAAGAIEVAIFVLGLHHQWLPPALNLDEPDPECDLNYARCGPVLGPFRTALSNSFGFGGINACVVLQARDLAAG